MNDHNSGNNTSVIRTIMSSRRYANTIYNENVNSPGAIQTDMNRELKESKDALESVLKQIPMGRWVVLKKSQML